jgi:hypothetical protein
MSLSPLMSPSMMRLRRYAVASSANGTCRPLVQHSTTLA